MQREIVHADAEKISQADDSGFASGLRLPRNASRHDLPAIAIVLLAKAILIKRSSLLRRPTLPACGTTDHCSKCGAVAAGWQAALIKRVGNDVLGVGPQPHIVGNDLNDVADQLIARHKRAA
jgi:hypothetical protein